MRKHIKYSNRDFFITAYTTEQEKNILLYLSVNDIPQIDDIFEIIKDNVHPLYNFSHKEKFLILILLRSISVGETYELKMKCNNCKKKFEFTSELSKIIQDSSLDKTFNGYEINDVISDDINDFVNFDTGEMDIDEYDELQDYINTHKVRFNLSTETICPYCETVNEVKFSEELILDNLSEDTIEFIYKTISSMIYYGNFSKKDIDSMFPFERSIYLGLLNTEIKKNQQKGIIE